MKNTDFPSCSLKIQTSMEITFCTPFSCIHIFSELFLCNKNEKNWKQYKSVNILSNFILSGFVCFRHSDQNKRYPLPFSKFDVSKEIFLHFSHHLHITSSIRRKFCLLDPSSQLIFLVETNICSTLIFCAFERILHLIKLILPLAKYLKLVSTSFDCVLLQWTTTTEIRIKKAQNDIHLVAD